MDPTIFENPTNSHRIVPFWFWNGTMSHIEIERQLNEMAAKGVGGAFICARQGLSIPYLSQAWFDAVRFAVQRASILGLEIWLYDEYPYPSGMAGGEVLLRYPDARHRMLEHCAIEAVGGQTVHLEVPWGTVLSALAVPVRNHTLAWSEAIDVRQWIGNVPAREYLQGGALTHLHQYRYFTYSPGLRLDWTPPAGAWKVLAIVATELQEFKYFGTFVDPGHREAVREFIRLTHDRYAETVGDYFGTTIRGVFSDEIHYLGRYPWSSGLPEQFRRTYGYDLTDHLPALFYQQDENTDHVRYHYRQALHELLTETYHGQIRQWADRHGLQYVAEVPTMRMSGQRYSDIPGGDSAHEKLGQSLHSILEKNTGDFRADPKSVSSLARQLNRRRAAIECFHSIGWSMTMQDAKWMLDRLAAMGINLFIFHAFYYSVDGMRKHDAPPSQFLQNAYWQYFRALADYAGRLSVIMTQGQAEIAVAILNPITSLWTFPADEADGPDDPLRRAWTDLANGLWQAHIEFDHLDPALLVEARIDQGTIILGQACYRVLVVPPLRNLEGPAWDKIEEFRDSGGLVIWAGRRSLAQGKEVSMDRSRLQAPMPSTPIRADVEPPRLGSVDRAGLRSVRFVPPGPGTSSMLATISEIGEILMEHGLRPVTVSAPAALDQGLLLQTRRLPDGSRLVFLCNQEAQTGSVTVCLSEGVTKHAETWDLTSGKIERVPDVWVTGSSLTVPVDSYGAVVLRIPGGQSDVPPASMPRAILNLDAQSDWSIQPAGPNIARFGRFQFHVVAGDHLDPPVEWDPGILVEPKTILATMADIEQDRTPPLRFHHRFGIPVHVNIAYPITAWYRATFEVQTLPKLCRLLMDAHAIRGEGTVFLNDHSITRDQFHMLPLYDQENQQVDVTAYLTVGSNDLRVRVLIGGDDDGLVDPIYLVGDFGVALGATEAPMILTREPSNSRNCALAARGYPYYSGILAFARRFHLTAVPAEAEFELNFNGWPTTFHECAEVIVNGVSLGVRAWMPYRFVGSTALLKTGVNDVEVRVTQSLSRTFEGRYFDDQLHEMRFITADGLE